MGIGAYKLFQNSLQCNRCGEWGKDPKRCSQCRSKDRVTEIALQCNKDECSYTEYVKHIQNFTDREVKVRDCKRMTKRATRRGGRAEWCSGKLVHLGVQDVHLKDKKKAKKARAAQKAAKRAIETQLAAQSKAKGGTAPG